LNKSNTKSEIGGSNWEKKNCEKHKRGQVRYSLTMKQNRTVSEGQKGENKGDADEWHEVKPHLFYSVAVCGEHFVAG
jgi:hypothetical protein